MKKTLAAIRDFLFWELGPYLITAYACTNAAIVGIALFSYEVQSHLVFFGYFCGFVFSLAAALYCLVQTVSHAFLCIFGKWLARTTFCLRNRNG